jgi:phage tail tape-measure protein
MDTNKTSVPDSNPANRDPLTGEPGSHPVGTGIGSAGGAAAGAAIGGAAAGPVGALVGGAVGAVAGGATGHAVGESANPTAGLPGEKIKLEEEDDTKDLPGRSSLLGLGS